MKPAPVPGGSLRMAELLSALSLAMDLGIGQPLEWVLSACLVGVRFGKFQGIPASGRRLAWTEIHIVRMKDGKLTEHWANIDQLGMQQQMEAGPVAAH